jgi:toxin ParE1/3/4
MRCGRDLALNIRFTPIALSDLDLIHAHIAEDDRVIADRVIARILQSISMLENFPLIGRTGRISGTRELSIVRLPYFAVYRLVNDAEIDVIAVIHERRRFPE